jgi:endonuclease/exonuclease/phosphatase family metal-dependent hydrolase
MTLHAFALLAVIVGTWNGKWFPSGRAEHRESPEIEQRTIAQAGRIFRDALKELDPRGTNDLILCFNEFRDPETAAALCHTIGRTNLTVAVTTRYRRRDRYDGQQDVIMTTLPIVESNFSVWKRPNRKHYPPRGAAFAAVLLDPATTAAVYCVHLKSNYGATTAAKQKANREKRTQAIDQLLSEVPRKGAQATFVCGDFNADKWRAEFTDETIFAAFEKARFLNVLETLPAAKRATYPNRWHGDSTLDYIMCRGFELDGMPLIVSSEGISDHHIVLARGRFVQAD